MAWDARFEEKLAVFRRYFAAFGHLNPPVGTVFESYEIGDALANLRKPGGLGKKPSRAEDRRRALEAIDPDWYPAWPVPWQRQWAKVRMCVRGGARVQDLVPGVQVDGEDVGAWLVEQRIAWWTLSQKQRERLEQLGVEAPQELPATQRAVEPAGADGGGEGGRVVVPAGASSWEKGIAAMRQYQAREYSVRVPRGHREMILIDHGPEGCGVVEESVRLGVWRSNARSRRDKLAPEQRREAEQLGLL